MPRFDEIELEPVPLGIEALDAAVTPVVEVEPAVVVSGGDAPRLKRLAALLTDLSLFVALALALSPLLPASFDWMAIASLAGFVLVMSYYYFVGTWLLWGKTIGGAIFDVRVVPAAERAMSLRDATARWAALYLSLATGGL
ncbi:MAG TPA: RDD family protein, partial [Thermoanaerobaculia bacterium]